MHSEKLTSNLLRLKDKLVSIPQPTETDHLEAVVGILLWEEEGEKGLQTLLVQRTERDNDPWSGQIAFPGGRIKPSEPPRTALHREVEEEVGITLDGIGTELGTLPVSHPMRRSELGVQPWVYGLTVKPRVTIGSEIANSFWTNLDELPATKTMSKITIRDWSREVESYIVEGKVVWGFTYRVLTELLPILKIPS